LSLWNNFDRWHKKPYLSVEDSVNQQVTKFPHTQSKRQRITQGEIQTGTNYFHSLYDLQTFFYILFTCSAGSQVTGALGVHPPSIHDYLFYCNNDLLIDIPNDDIEEEFLQINEYSI
jgi:hypothetical protein